jgi:diguanylate cyclase (GGDEF)-like protein
MFNWIADGMVLSGALLLVRALAPVGCLIAQLPPGPLRNRWHATRAFICLFIAGYSAYVLLFGLGHDGWHDQVVPAVFLFGAAFVWMTTTSALQTVIDLRRVALLEHETITDPLIGIYNRRYMDRRLEEEMAKAKRHSLPLSVLMLDVDHFKRVNDQHGHQAGDLVLCHLGKLLLSAIRTSDIAARYGGEELVVVAPHTPASEALALAERLRRYLASHPLVLTGEQQVRKEIQVTISIGVAALTPDLSDVTLLLRQADEALYLAKQRGRNRAELYPGPAPA